MRAAIWKTPFARIKERLFRQEAYENFMGTIWKLETSLPETCNINLTSDVGKEGKILIYDPLIYLLMGTGLVWVVALS
jgi:hypothetical protein